MRLRPRPWNDLSIWSTAYYTTLPSFLKGWKGEERVDCKG